LISEVGVFLKNTFGTCQKNGNAGIPEIM
jgi:hypothetical protein